MGRAISWEKEWVQYLVIVVLAIGALIALQIRNVIIGGVLMLLCGIVAGRIWFMKRGNEQILPYVLILAGFALGVFLSSWWSSRIVNVIMFTAGGYISYMLHKKEVITFKSQNFLK